MFKQTDETSSITNVVLTCKWMQTVCNAELSGRKLVFRAIPRSSDMRLCGCGAQCERRDEEETREQCFDGKRLGIACVQVHSLSADLYTNHWCNVECASKALT